jgi:hypothetical protein
MPSPSILAFDAEVARAIDAAGITADAVALDALADPAGAAAALRASTAGDLLVLRVAPPLGGGDDAFGPRPVDPAWLRLVAGSAEVGVAPLRGGAMDRARAERVELEETEGACCDAPGCTLRRTRASAWLVLAGARGEGVPSRMLLAEVDGVASGGASRRVQAFGAALGAALGVPVHGADGRPIAQGAAAADLGSPPEEGSLARPDVLALSRFVLRAEGGPVVLRDLALAGPRETVRRDAIAGALFMLLAAVAVGLAVRAIAHGALEAAFGAGAAAALLGFFGTTFLSMARFAARYVARSTALVAVHAGRLVVAPWVSREGAIDRRPEGHYGAAVPLPEVHGLTVAARGARSVVVLDTEHGPFEALVAEREVDARFFCAALERVLEAAAHPEARESARQRARARARAAAAAQAI